MLASYNNSCKAHKYIIIYNKKNQLFIQIEKRIIHQKYQYLQHFLYINKRKKMNTHNVFPNIT